MGFFGSFGSKLAGVSHKVLHASDDNRWLRLAGTATGTEFGKDAARMGGHHAGSAEWKALAADISPIAQYFTNNQTARRGAAISEDNAQNMGMSEQERLAGQIDRAYGMDHNGGALESNLRGYINQIDDTLNHSGFAVRGEERAAAQKARQQYGSLLAQLVAARGSDAGTLNKAQVAINSLGGRAAAMAKHDATRELDTRLASNVTQENAAAFTRGVSGSSFDQAAQAKNVADYTLGRGNIANTLAEGDRTFRDTLDTQRRALQDRALSVGSSAIDTAAIATNQQNAAKSAYDNLTGRSLGQLLATSSDLVQNDQVQRASGNLGFRGMMSPPPFTQSRSTGGSLSR